MEFWSTIAGLLRRRWLLVAGIGVALAAGMATFVLIPNTYVTSTTMVLTTTAYGGTTSDDPIATTERTNPMLNFNDSLKTTSAILIWSMNSEDVLEQLGATGSTELVVNDGRTNPDLLGLNGPFVYIEGRGASADRAEQVVVGAQALMREKLQEWQSSLKAPPKTFVSLSDVVQPAAPVIDRKRESKLALLAGALGFLLVLASAYAWERVSPRRVRPRAAQVLATVEQPALVRSPETEQAPVAPAASQAPLIPATATASAAPAAPVAPVALVATAAPIVRQRTEAATPSQGRTSTSPRIRVPRKQAGAPPRRQRPSRPTLAPTSPHAPEAAVLPAPVKVKARSRGK